MRNSFALAAVALMVALVSGASSLDAQVNELIVVSSEAAPGTTHSVEIVGVNVADVSGYTIVVDYDEMYVNIVDVNITDTLADAVGAEFVQFNDFEDFFILGVLLDALPPFDGQVIPAVPDLELVYAYCVCELTPAASLVDQVQMTLVNGLGSPPLQNIFVIDFQSVSPVLTSGSIGIVAEDPFIRGDANESGELDLGDVITTVSFVIGQIAGPPCVARMDSNDDGQIEISDVLYTLNYLYIGGPIIPAPFPAAGLDPTPDGTTCID